MSRGYNNNFNRGRDSRERANQSDQRYDSFYGNQNQKRGNYGMPQQLPQQQGFNNNQNQNQNLNLQMLSTIQQTNLLSALLNNQNIGSNQLQDSRGPRRDGNMSGFSRGMGRGASRGFSRGASRGAYGGGERSGDKRRSQYRGAEKTIPPPNKKSKEVIAEPKTDVEEDIEIPDEDVVVSEKFKLPVEKLRERTEEIERNAVDEDIEKFKVFSFNGKGYRCATCGLSSGFTMKEATFSHHLMSKSHVMKVIDARTNQKYQDERAILDINLNDDDWFEKSDLAKSILICQAKEEMKVEKLKELKALREYNSTPSNFYRFVMGLRKSAIQVGDEVLISTLVESTLAVKDITEASRFGCEFVEPVTGFHCRLCSMSIHKGDNVMSHIAGKVHKSNYAAYLAKNKEYEKVQKNQNEELYTAMKQNEEDNIVLAETKNADNCRFLSQLDYSNMVRIPSLMNLKRKYSKVPEEQEESSKEKEETVKDEDETTEPVTTETVEGEETAGDEESSKDEETAIDEEESAENKEENEEETIEGKEET